MQILYHTLLTLHIVGFVVAMGTVVTSIMAYNQFWKLLSVNKAQGMAAFKSFLNTRLLGLLGLLTAIVAGVSMEISLRGAHADFLWIKIKMLLVISLLINGFSLGRTTSVKLERLIAGNDENLSTESEIKKLKRKTDIFQFAQLIIFIFIIVMAAFRFA